MTAPHIVDPAGLLAEALSEASPDLMRSLLQTMINALLSADADTVVGAEWGKPNPDWTAQRNGYRHRELDTRVGTVDVAIPSCARAPTSRKWLHHYQGLDPYAPGQTAGPAVHVRSKDVTGAHGSGVSVAGSTVYVVPCAAVSGPGR